jgi:hypothetical protein
MSRLLHEKGSTSKYGEQTREEEVYAGLLDY